MRVLARGGTGFIGPPTVQGLIDSGHEVVLFHRGDAEPQACVDADHIHGDFATFAQSLPRLIDLRPDVALDTVPYIDKAGYGVSHFARHVDRAVVVTSFDVYRAFAVAWGSEHGSIEPTPLTEDSPLRSQPAPDLTPDIDFDNLEVERALLDRPKLRVTVLRLPMIYGPNDPQHRLFNYVRRMDDGRDAIILDEARATLRWSRGYVDKSRRQSGSRLPTLDQPAVSSMLRPRYAHRSGVGEVNRGYVRLGRGDRRGAYGVTPILAAKPTGGKAGHDRQQRAYPCRARIRGARSTPRGARAQRGVTRANPPTEQRVDYSMEDCVLAALAR